MRPLRQITCLIMLFVATTGLTQESSETSESGEGVSITVVPGGTQRNVSNRWATLSVNGLNQSESDIDQLVTVWLGENSNRQFAREVWIPAGSRRQSWLPVLMPEIQDPTQFQIPMTSVQLDRSGDGEAFQSNVTGEPRSTRSLLVSRSDARCSAVLGNVKNTPEDYLRTKDLMELIYKCRDADIVNDDGLGIASLHAHFLPPNAKSLDGIDQLIVGGNRLTHDTESSDQILDWVRGGGKLWVMLDQLEPKYISQLLGREACFEELDRVELNDFKIYRTDLKTNLPTTSVALSYEQPKTLVRVYSEAEQTLCTIDGWPAVFWNPVGKGEILFTTIGLESLVDNARPIEPFSMASADFFSRAPQSEANSSKLAGLIEKEIGYRIPNRFAVATILGLQLLAMIGLGIWFAMRKQLHWLSLLIPISAVSATLLLIQMGRSNATAIPPTVSRGQLIRVSDNEATIDTTMAFYSRDDSFMDVLAAPGTSMLLDAEQVSGEFYRTVWSDDGTSQISRFRQRPGAVRRLYSETTLKLPGKKFARGSFTQRGFEAELVGLDIATCSDSIAVSTAAPSLALQNTKSASGQDKLVGSSDDVLLKNQFIDASVVTELQRDHQEILRNLVDSNTNLIEPQPRLLTWVPPMGESVSFADDFEKRGAALLSLPIEFRDAAKGQEFFVPSSFIKLENAAGAEGFTALFNERTGEWLQDLTKGNFAKLRCRIPPSLLPCKLDRASIRLKLKAPSRKLEVKVLKSLEDNEYEIIHEEQSPNGIVEIEVDQSQDLPVINGGLGLIVSISKTATEMESQTYNTKSMPVRKPEARDANKTNDVWGIEYLQVGVGGVTQ